MQLTQATLALVLAGASTFALPTGNGGSPQPSGGTCNGGAGVNYCANKGVWSEYNYQDCEAEGGSPYCCSSGSGVNALTCADVGDIGLDLGGLLSRDANGGGSQPPPVNDCNGGNAANYCVNKGVWSEANYQDCYAEGGSPTCCTSGDGLNVLTCATVGDVTVTLRKRNNPEPQPQQGGTCNGGNAVNVCENKGYWSEENEQDCYAYGGSPYCCSAGDGLNLGPCASTGDITIGGLTRSEMVKRNGGGSGSPVSGKSNGGTCNGGDAVNACHNQGTWSASNEQDCDAEGGSPYCCSSGDGINVLTCTSTGDITVDLGLGEVLSKRLGI